eukprot:jgi/Mesvir1/4696/Mv21591-RA.1
MPDPRLPPPRHTIPVIQPTLLRWNSGDGTSSLVALLRTDTGEDRVAESYSFDGGRLWGPVRKNQLPNPNSGIDGVTLRDGRQLLVYNHVAFERRRFPLNIALLPADAQPPINPSTGFPGRFPNNTGGGGVVGGGPIVWLAAGELENEPGEFSYPAVIQTSDGLVHIMYTWHRTRMRHVIVDPDKLALLPMPNGVWPGSMTGGYAARRRKTGFRQNHGCLIPAADRFPNLPKTRDGFCQCQRGRTPGKEEEEHAEASRAQASGGGVAAGGGGATWAVGAAAGKKPAGGKAGAGAGGEGVMRGKQGGGGTAAGFELDAAGGAVKEAPAPARGSILPISLFAPFKALKRKGAGKNGTPGTAGGAAASLLDSSAVPGTVTEDTAALAGTGKLKAKPPSAAGALHTKKPAAKLDTELDLLHLVPASDTVNKAAQKHEKKPLAKLEADLDLPLNDVAVEQAPSGPVGEAGGESSPEPASSPPEALQPEPPVDMEDRSVVPISEEQPLAVDAPVAQ